METLCSHSERSEGEIRVKLRNLGLSSAQAESIVKSLVDRRFIDDRRFAGVFARNKLIYSGYGRYRINLALRAKGVAPDIIAEALDALDSEAYTNKLDEIIERKARSMSETSGYESRNKIYRYAASRGFESDLIIAALKRVLRRLNPTP